MPKVKYSDDGNNVEAESFERHIRIPVNSAIVKNLNVDDEVEMTLKGKVTSLEERQIPAIGSEGEEEEKKTIRELGVTLSEAEVYEPGKNEFEDLARDEE